MGGSASKVDDVTALPSRHKMADMCYYGIVMTTTRWWLCVTILHLQQYSHRLNLFYYFFFFSRGSRPFLLLTQLEQRALCGWVVHNRLASRLKTSEAILPGPAIRHYDV